MPGDGEFTFLPRKELLSYEEIVRLVRIFASLGVEKVRITGGEPLLRKELDKLIESISSIPAIRDLALTTNGYKLPEMAYRLREAGLKRITVSLNTLRGDRFRAISGSGFDVDRVIEGIEIALKAGFEEVKLNAVIVRGVNEDEIIDLAKFAREKGIYLRFIEFMDVGTLNRWDLQSVFSADEILEVMKKEFEFLSEGRAKGETSLNFRYTDMDLGFGIIASITRPFCGDCSRIRLSADGHLYTCLFSSSGFNIKRYVRGGCSDGRIARIIYKLWAGREDRYSEVRFEKLSGESPSFSKVEMFRIGG